MTERRSVPAQAASRTLEKPHGKKHDRQSCVKFNSRCMAKILELQASKHAVVRGFTISEARSISQSMPIPLHRDARSHRARDANVLDLAHAFCASNGAREPSWILPRSCLTIASRSRRNRRTRRLADTLRSQRGRLRARHVRAFV